MSGAANHCGKSRQDYATPPEFIAAVKRRFDIEEFAWDLAAAPENTQAWRFFDESSDSLAQDWNGLVGDLWLNPPFANIAPWVKKCSAYRGTGRIFLLVPASVGSKWFCEHVYKYAWVFFLTPRLSFDGKNPFPKDCMLAVYSPSSANALDVWQWR